MVWTRAISPISCSLVTLWEPEKNGASGMIAHEVRRSEMSMASTMIPEPQIPRAIRPSSVAAPASEVRWVSSQPKRLKSEKLIVTGTRRSSYLANNPRLGSCRAMAPFASSSSSSSGAVSAAAPSPALPRTPSTAPSSDSGPNMPTITSDQ